MKITDQKIYDILALYGIREPVLERETLIYIDRPYKETRAVKLYIRLRLASRPVVLKLLHLPMIRDDTPERQSRLSEAFRSRGLPTPECLALTEKDHDRQYIASVRADSLRFLVKLEEDAGEGITEPDEALAPVLGCLLGKTHSIAEKERLSVGPGAFYTEFTQRNTEYDLLWSMCGTDFLPVDMLDRIRTLYGEKMKILRESFSSLPRFAVQGDLYYMNLTKKAAEYRVIDYDRMGDEVLLTDMILTWHRFWFDPHIFGPVTGTAMERAQRERRLWEQFYTAYCAERKLTAPELKQLGCTYQLLGSVYETRMLATIASAGKKELAAELLPEVEELLTRSCIFAR